MSTNLTNQLLIAMPALADPNFLQTVSLICEHNEQGAMGIIINRPLEITLGEVFKQMKIDNVDGGVSEASVIYGGPVQVDRGFILHRPVGDWQATLIIEDEIGLTTSLDILEDIAKGDGPGDSLVALGYAGWAAGQLEQEIAENAWLTVKADSQIVFDLPFERRWQAAATKLGVDLNLLAGDAGHA